MVDPNHQNDSSYSPVRHKKQDGSITLSDTHFCFQSEHTKLMIEWGKVVKHQISPANYPKALLKLVLNNESNLTFQMMSREELDRIRVDITQRLQQTRKNNNTATLSGQKRPLSQIQTSSVSAFGDLDPTALAVARSTLLASDPSLRQQHQYLVQETQTVTEDDFWKTHQHLLEDEYARISGLAKAGASSVLQAHLPTSGRVTLGVEEMRQIFILYPAVHKAYEDKVPLELSDEQFWRKYLESEYFHRDRGRMGSASRTSDAKTERQEARAAAVSTDDLFSRYDQKLQEKAAETEEVTHRKWGQRLAVGQFDLARTFETERGNILEVRDNHPMNSSTDDGKGSRVIRKYNRHWAMVLHPDAAVAGSDLLEVARHSIRDVGEKDQEVAKPNGGLDEEMYRLTELAENEDDFSDELTLKNIESYYAGQLVRNAAASPAESAEESARRYVVFSQAIKSKLHQLVLSLEDTTTSNASTLRPDVCFPPPDLGQQLLTALTRKMAQDARSESSFLLMHDLPDDFKQNLQHYFRRSSELLRHFFVLRDSPLRDKLQKIVLAMESFYREMDAMRRSFPQTESGQLMSKMCLPIMDQLDWAFQLHREGLGGAGGGFVAVEEG